MDEDLGFRFSGVGFGSFTGRAILETLSPKPYMYVHMCIYTSIGFGSHISKNSNLLILLHGKDILHKLQILNRIA